MLITSQTTAGVCPLCERRDCGGPSDIQPVDATYQEVIMASGPPTPHRVVFNGRETIMRLSDEEAKRRGATPLTGRQPATAPQRDDAEETPAVKTRTAQNKARTAAPNKTTD